MRQLISCPAPLYPNVPGLVYGASISRVFPTRKNTEYLQVLGCMLVSFDVNFTRMPIDLKFVEWIIYSHKRLIIFRISKIYFYLIRI